MPTTSHNSDLDTQPKSAATPTIRRKISILVNLSRPRTWVFAVSAFLFGYMSLSSWSSTYAVLGSFSFAVLTAATNLINAYTDRIEDSVNSPRRTAWIQQLGLSNLKYATIATYLLSISLAVPLGVFFLVVFAFGVFDSIFYSLRPLRFKRHIAFALPSFAGAVAIPFLAGNSVYGGVNLLNPLFIIITLFMLSYGTIKNGPDYFGDRVAGLRTSSTIFNNKRSEGIFNLALLLSPYVAALAFMVLGIISPTYLIVLPFALVPVYLIFGSMGTYDNERLEKFHIYGNFYGVGFLLLMFYVTVATLLSAGIAAALYAYVFIITYLKKDSRVLLSSSSSEMQPVPLEEKVVS
jgi:4-hydroxybenzoate polyprenyltransferase